MGHVVAEHQDVYPPVRDAARGDGDVVCGRAHVADASRVAPAGQRGDDPALSEDRRRVVPGIEILGKEDVDDIGAHGALEAAADPLETLGSP